MSARFAFLIIMILTSVEPVRASRDLFLKVVGSVADHVVSSREVEANSILDRALFGGREAIKPISLGQEEFKAALNKLLIERMVYEEAKVFNVAEVIEGELNQSILTIKKKLAGSGPARERLQTLGFTEAEQRETVLRKLRANKFIKYKSNSSYVQVSDQEARDYFNKNRLKFGTLDFEKFRENIKVYLAKTNAEARLRDWFEILRKKHSVKNLLLESGHDLAP